MISMVSLKERIGTGIREFLEYYLLVILNEGISSEGSETKTKQRMKELILERSSDNNNFRQGGALLVADCEIDVVIKKLLQRKCIKNYAYSDTFEIADKGKKTLEEYNNLKEQTSGSKDEATQKLISLLDPSPPKKYVLDVGTGEGYLAFRIAEAGFKVLGIDSGNYDYSKDSIKKAIEKKERKSDIEFKVADVKNLTDMENSFDYVVSSQAVHCMKDQKGCISAIYSLLKTGGKFICSDLSISLLGFLHHGFHSFLALSEEEWKSFLEKCGYINVKIHSVDDFCVVEGEKPT